MSLKTVNLGSAIFISKFRKFRNFGDIADNKSCGCYCLARLIKLETS